MSERPYKVLILDWDEDTLISLQQVLEDAGIDTTITWDEVEARKLFKDKPFNLVLVGDHPPELTAETILRDFNVNQSSCPCLVMRTNPSGSEHSGHRSVGGVVPKREPFRVLERVRKYWQSQRSGADSKSVWPTESQPAERLLTGRRAA